MKKIIINLLIIISALSLASCNNKGIKLEFNSYEVTEELSSYLSQKYNLYDNENRKVNYHVIDNYDDYSNIYYEITALELDSKEIDKQLFENNVLLIRERTVSGSKSFIPVEYYYVEDQNVLLVEQINKPKKNANYPAVVIGLYIDIIEMPRIYYEKFITIDNQ